MKAYWYDFPECKMVLCDKCAQEFAEQGIADMDSVEKTPVTREDCDSFGEVECAECLNDITLFPEVK